MAHAHCDGSLQNQNQGSFHIKGQGSFFHAIWAWSGLHLSYFINICSGIKRGQILMTERLPPGEAIAGHLDTVLAPLVLLGAKGVTGLKLKPARHLQEHNSILLLICSLSFLIPGAHAELKSNEAASISICVCAPPRVWEISDHTLKVVAVTILAAITTIGVAVAGRSRFNLRSPVGQTIPHHGPEIQAISAALPIIPVVQGDDLDDVLARAPIPTRLNSPLSWL
ncbi:hypothetical protein KC19_12G097800 [Ceratodon purpureus]|uniref:Uncharacterized protein n=1 Tax=Ceratodon purpureus TaxID=3225 RepID=A0A8T0G5H1_CERPU|nr:hypothetical protein KC19_12G097800 [Ceratodon purpureus]